MEQPTPPVPQMQDRRAKILGTLPKNAQARVLGAIALIMIVIIMLSGRHAPKAAAPRSSAIPEAMDPNQARIQEYRTRLEEQTEKLTAEEAQLANTKARLGVAPTPTAPAPTVAAPAPASVWAAPPDGAVTTERQKREYQSLFASNVALSYRPALLPTAVSTIASPALSTEKSASAPSADKPTAMAPTAHAGTYRLFEGTFIETVLTNQLDASFSGPVNCMVTTNVYSRDGQTLLIPQGTRVLGEVRKVDSLGQQRLAVTFHRLILPDGSSVSLDQFQGLDQVGQTGLRDQVNHHYLQIFGVSLAIGAVAGLTQANTHYSLDESAAEAYEQGVSNSLSQSALHILDRFLNVLPTFTIREGYRIKIYLSQDLWLSAYDAHSPTQD